MPPTHGTTGCRRNRNDTARANSTHDCSRGACVKIAPHGGAWRRRSQGLRSPRMRFASARRLHLPWITRRNHDDSVHSIVGLAVVRRFAAACAAACMLVVVMAGCSDSRSPNCDLSPETLDTYSPKEEGWGKGSFLVPRPQPNQDAPRPRLPILLSLHILSVDSASVGLMGILGLDAASLAQWP
jgi:hypothetical protein